jgi:hypothetical protein
VAQADVLNPNTSNSSNAYLFMRHLLVSGSTSHPCATFSVRSHRHHEIIAADRWRAPLALSVFVARAFNRSGTKLGG